MDKIFVFGSNEAGRHGAGAAKWALNNRGAIYGQGYGLQGQSFAIPTKDKTIRTLPLDRIGYYIKFFKQFALNNPYLEFELTPIGCGLAGYKPVDIAPMFRNAPINIELPQEFKDILDE